MAKIFKFGGYLVDPNGYFSAAEIKDHIDGFERGGSFSQHVHVMESEIEEWKDNLPINKTNCEIYDLDKYFTKQNNWSVDTTRILDLCVGEKFVSFNGEMVTILMISQDVEIPGDFMVIYQDSNGYVWHEPLGKFLSEVDHERYPDVKQRYRFERYSYIEREKDLNSRISQLL